VLHDPEAARECWQENQILRRIAPQAVEPNGGLFVALDDQDLTFRDAFLEGCRSVGIPAHPISVSRALAMEPALNPSLRAAVQVPDAVMDAWRLPLHFFATAQANGTEIRNFTEVVALQRSGRRVAGVEVMDLRTNRLNRIAADLVVNAAGPWAGRIAAMAGIGIPLQPGPGVMVSVRGRLTQRVIHRLQAAGEGDIIVPQRGLSILGTTAWLADDPDAVTVPPGHVERLLELGRMLVPALRGLKPHSVWSASRPLLQGEGARDPFRISRTFDCFDHGSRDGVEGLVTLIGGKATTMRAMAAKTADLICRKTGRQIACRTQEEVLLPYRRFWRPA
jgi:glycerol-3-phosphate dehydrogenase